MNSVQELEFYIYIHVDVLITGISLFFEKQQHGNLLKQGKPCKFHSGKNVNKTGYRLMNLKFAKFELSRAIFTPQLSILVFENDFSYRA